MARSAGRSAAIARARRLEQCLGRCHAVASRRGHRGLGGGKHRTCAALPRRRQVCRDIREKRRSGRMVPAAPRFAEKSAPQRAGRCVAGESGPAPGKPAGERLEARAIAECRARGSFSGGPRLRLLPGVPGRLRLWLHLQQRGHGARIAHGRKFLLPRRYHRANRSRVRANGVHCRRRSPDRCSAKFRSRARVSCRRRHSDSADSAPLAIGLRPSADPARQPVFPGAAADCTARARRPDGKFLHVEPVVRRDQPCGREPPHGAPAVLHAQRHHRRGAPADARPAEVSRPAARRPRDHHPGVLALGRVAHDLNDAEARRRQRLPATRAATESGRARP